MKHGISDQDWEGYVEDRLPAAERDRIEAHLIGCLGCWEFYEQMAATTERLREAGAATRRGIPLSDEQLHAGLRGVFERVRAGQPGHATQRGGRIEQRLRYLEAVMAPMCGAQTAANALRAAARGSAARSLDEVTTDNWEPFLRSLTSIAAVMCGETGAHLVWRSGQF
ncbi:MAG TPA: zf-HC2 domain-containing protein [Blastocatellia bacterium]|nr:zf-HC2 domain-containing protein [Blastocatellia bacterium]